MHFFLFCPIIRHIHTLKSISGYLILNKGVLFLILCSYRATSLHTHFPLWAQLISEFCRIGGSIPIVFSYYSEFLAQEKRGEHLSWLCMFWMIGGIYASAMAWAIIPHYGEHENRLGILPNLCVVQAWWFSLFSHTLKSKPDNFAALVEMTDTSVITVYLIVVP